MSSGVTLWVIIKTMNRFKLLVSIGITGELGYLMVLSLLLIGMALITVGYNHKKWKKVNGWRMIRREE